MGEGDVDDLEAELLRRFAALQAPPPQGPEDSLDAGVGDEDNTVEDVDVEAFLASLSQANIPHDTDQALLRASRSEITDVHLDAKRLLREASAYVGKPQLVDIDHEGEDGETEEGILARAIDEAELEKEAEDKTLNPASPSTGDASRLSPALAEASSTILPGRSNISRSSSPGLAFPSLPTHIPEDVDDDLLDTATSAQFALLSSLSLPAPPQPKIPSPPKRQPGQGWNLPGYQDSNDDDPDSWCCICSKDAEVQCLGCDGDGYCEECWRDGHTGVDSRHRVKRFGSGKKAVGAR